MPLKGEKLNFRKLRETRTFLVWHIEMNCSGRGTSKPQAVDKYLKETLERGRWSNDVIRERWGQRISCHPLIFKQETTCVWTENSQASSGLVFSHTCKCEQGIRFEETLLELKRPQISTDNIQYRGVHSSKLHSGLMRRQSTQSTRE